MSRFAKPAAPSATSGFRIAENEGNLLVFEAPIGRESVETQNGDRDVAIPARVHNVDTGESWTEPYLFGAVVVPQLTTGPDGDLLGRIVKGEAQPGKSAPWILEDPNADDELKAEAFMDRLASSEAAF